jgi:flagellar biosynthetic protein FliP
VLLPAAARAEEAPDWLGSFTGTDPQSVATAVRMLLLVTVFSVVPSIILMTTCFPRVFIVLSFLRRAVGTQDLPPAMVTAGLAMILTSLIMLPVGKRVHSEAYVPFVNGELESAETAMERAAVPLKEFMLEHTYRKDLQLFVELSARAGAEATAAGPAPQRTSTLDDSQPVESLGFFVILPAFVLSELKTAFQMGFLLYLPFLVIDLAVSGVLISMGMFMLPPALISVPLKVLVFVLADGWNLVVTQLVHGFQAMT